jgi:Ca2+:H+ antiporter
MTLLLQEIRHNKLLWLLLFVPIMFVAAHLRPTAHTLLFVLSVLAIVPLASLPKPVTPSAACSTPPSATSPNW